MPVRKSTSVGKAKGRSRNEQRRPNGANLEQFAESARLEAMIRKNLAGLGYAMRKEQAQ